MPTTMAFIFGQDCSFLRHVYISQPSLSVCSLSDVSSNKLKCWQKKHNCIGDQNPKEFMTKIFKIESKNGSGDFLKTKWINAGITSKCF